MFHKPCVTESSQSLGNSITQQTRCSCVGTVGTLISVPDHETMYQAFFHKNLFFVEMIYVSILGRNCTQGPIKKTKIKTLTLVISSRQAVSR